MSTTIAIDLAKTVFELAACDAEGRIIERKRLILLCHKYHGIIAPSSQWG